MWNTSLSDGYGMSGYGGGYGGGWGGFGGGTGGAFVGGLAGSLVGDAFFGRDGRRGDGCGEKVVQINENGKGHDGCGHWELFKEMSDDRREQVQQTVALQQDLFGIQKDVFCTAAATDKQLCAVDAHLADCCCQEKELILQSQYNTSLQLCNLDHHIEKCCCEEKELIMKMGYDTQLRDACYKNDTDKQLAEIKCLIKETEMCEQLREQERIIAGFRERETREQIRDCIKDAFCKESSALNQIGVNQKLTAPDTTFWPPFVPNLGCC